MDKVGKTVEDYLRDIDYSEDHYYVPSEFALEFVNFIKLVNGAKGEENKTPVVHYRMLDELVGPNNNIVNMCARGLSKTTLLGEYLYLYLAVYGELPGFGRVDYALYVGDSIDNAVKKMRNRLERRWENSKFLQTYVPVTRFTDIRWYFKNKAGKEFVVSGFGGKTGVRGPLALDEKLYTDQGPVTMDKVSVGDRVATPTGGFAKVIGKSEIIHEPMYRLVFADGRSVKVSENHLNALWHKPLNKLQNRVKTNITTQDLLADVQTHGLKGKYGWRYYMQVCEPVQYSKKKLPLHPYLVGLLLGDGNIPKGKSPRITGLPQDVTEYAQQVGKHYRIALHIRPDGRAGHQDLLNLTVYDIHQELDYLDLSGVTEVDKRIPEGYLQGSVKQRQQLLAGLLDTDGSVDPRTGSVSFTSISKELAHGVQELGRSLGMQVSCKVFQQRPGNRQDLYRLTLVGNFNPFRLSGKAQYWKPSPRWHGVIPLVQLETIAQEPSQCVLLDDPVHEFMTTGYIPTHNTVELNTRPQLAVLDDLISDEDARSMTVISSIEDTVYKAINYALHPTRNKIIWSGTPFNSKDPLYKAVESGAWAVNVYPVCEEFPCEREEFKGAWEDRFTYEYVKDKYDKALLAGKIATFNQELMLRIMSEEDRLIEDADIVWYQRSRVLNNKGAYNFYITTDFATTEKASGDFSVISVWAYNNNGDWLWVDGICRKQLMNKNVDDLFRFAQKYAPQQVGIEVTGQQQGFISWIQNEMVGRNSYFNLASDTNSNRPGIRPNTNKMQRFNVVVPLFKTHKIWFPEDLKESPEMQEAMQELTLASMRGFKSKHDDFIDTISMLGSLKAWKPSQVTPNPGAGDGMWPEDIEEEYQVLDSYVV